MSEKFTKENILKQLTSILVEDFEIDEKQITPEAHLF